MKIVIFPLSQKCNGRIECSNGEDERNCPTTTTPAATTTTPLTTTTTTTQPTTTSCTGFKCRVSGVCLSEKYICDGTRDCRMGDDEDCCNKNTNYR